MKSVDVREGFAEGTDARVVYCSEPDAWPCRARGLVGDESRMPQPWQRSCVCNLVDLAGFCPQPASFTSNSRRCFHFPPDAVSLSLPHRIPSTSVRTLLFSTLLPTTPMLSVCFGYLSLGFSSEHSVATRARRPTTLPGQLGSKVQAAREFACISPPSRFPHFLHAQRGCSLISSQE